MDGYTELDAELDRIAPAAALAALPDFRMLLWRTAYADALALSEVFSGTLKAFFVITSVASLSLSLFLFLLFSSSLLSSSFFLLPVFVFYRRAQSCTVLNVSKAVAIVVVI